MFAVQAATLLLLSTVHHLALALAGISLVLRRSECVSVHSRATRCHACQDCAFRAPRNAGAPLSVHRHFSITVKGSDLPFIMTRSGHSRTAAQGRFESLGHLNVRNQTFNTGGFWVVFRGTLRLTAAYERVRIRAAEVKMETKWKHRRIGRLGCQRKFLIENGGQGQNRTADTMLRPLGVDECPIFAMQRALGSVLSLGLATTF